MAANASSIRCLITAGPTREFFDPVRYMSNPSSGKMGFALAKAAARLGWTVDLVTGPVCLLPPAGVKAYPAITGEEMFTEADRMFDACDIFIATAAVMDFRPKQYMEHKLKKTGGGLTVELEPTRDILKTLAARKRPGQLVVGFAAETRNVVGYAREKLIGKNCDYVIANQIGAPGAGFQTDTNTVTVVTPQEPPYITLGPDSKANIADSLVDLFAKHRAAAHEG